MQGREPQQDKLHSLGIYAGKNVQNISLQLLSR